MAIDKLILGQIIHCTTPYELEIIPDGFVLVDDQGVIITCGDLKNLPPEAKNAPQQLQLTKSQLLLPGLIDTHIHGPQYPNVGLGYDKPLLEWLDCYTFKLEKQYSDLKLSQTVYDAVVEKTISHGTTTACYFASMFLDSSLVLVDSAIKFGQRALVGKINMTRMAPEDYVETPEKSLENTKKFVQEVLARGCDLVKPIITPRFAISVDMEHMKDLSEIAKNNDLHVQSHISENKAEVAMIGELFGDSYANVYHKAGLLGPKTVMAHAIYLSDEELAILKKTGTGIAHCPESNSNLQSGLCDIQKLKSSGLHIGLGSDIAGGASPSIIYAMKAAITTSVHISLHKEDYKPLNYADVFYMATLGGAKALALEDQIGNFQQGKKFDALIVDLDRPGSNVDLIFDSLSPQELLQKLIFTGDDRNVVNVFVEGKSVKQ